MGNNPQSELDSDCLRCCKFDLDRFDGPCPKRGGVKVMDLQMEAKEHGLKSSKKKLNLLKALRGRSWGASPETILHSYRSYIRPLLEYSCILFAHADKQLQTKIQSIETEAIKIAFNLPPWTSNYWCYTQINFTPILSRMKSLSKDFLDKNRKDQLISELINNSKHSNLGLHSPVFKALNW